MLKLSSIGWKAPAVNNTQLKAAILVPIGRLSPGLGFLFLIYWWIDKERAEASIAPVRYHPRYKHGLQLDTTNCCQPKH